MSFVNAEKPEQIQLDVSPSEQVTALAYRAAPRGHAGVTLILAHGAGANQASSFMVRFATSLAARGLDTVTFNFVYTEQRRRLPDRNDKLEHCYRTVIEAARGGKFHDHAGRPKLVIGGKSMGGRIAADHQLWAPGVIVKFSPGVPRLPAAPAGPPRQAAVEAPPRHWRADAVRPGFARRLRHARGVAGHPGRIGGGR